ncbi:MAG TPA: alpha/beta hydrolase [Pseudomonadales bacterium]
MAECILTIAVLTWLLTQYAKTRIRWKFSLITQFIVGWLVLELAWLHGVIHAVLLVMTLGDFNDWSFGTLIGVGLTGFNIYRFWLIHRHGDAAGRELETALKTGLGDDYRQAINPARSSLLDSVDPQQWLKPFSFACPGMETIRGINYGPHERNTLDLHRPLAKSDKPRPVMLQIHGGGWTLGYGEKQALPLRNKLVEAGWIFVAINYRLSPDHKFPAHLVDCKQALAWIKNNIADYGGDPDFIMTTGGSAGGHLCSLLALTANRHQELLQPGFADADTTVQGCISMYGVYDFADRHQHRADMPMIDFLQDYVMPDSLADNPELWDIASPVAQVQAERPPFMVIHGELDTLAFVEDARHFAAAMKAAGDAPLAWAELSQAQHAFDIFWSPRCVHSVNAMHRFAEWVYSRHLDGSR